MGNSKSEDLACARSATGVFSKGYIATKDLELAPRDDGFRTDSHLDRRFPQPGRESPAVFGTETPLCEMMMVKHSHSSRRLGIGFMVGEPKPNDNLGLEPSSVA